MKNFRLQIIAWLWLTLSCILYNPVPMFSCTIVSGIDEQGQVWNMNNEDGPFGVASFMNVFPKEKDTKYGYYTFCYLSPDDGQGGGIEGGMNEAGLTFDFNAIRYIQDFDPKRKKAFPRGDAAILSHILGNLSTVQEVIDFFETYWFQKGFRSAQMHVADRQGNFAIISASGIKKTKSGQPLISTNFDICGKEDSSSCWRYPIIESKLSTNIIAKMSIKKVLSSGCSSIDCTHLINWLKLAMI